MPHYEYKVVPAPRRGMKGKGVKGAEARFALAIQTLMNEQAASGWEFLRAEALPSEERHGLASAQTVYRDLLVFRRDRAADEAPVNATPLEESLPETPESDEPQAPEPLETYGSAPSEATPEETPAEEESETAPAAFETTRRD